MMRGVPSLALPSEALPQQLLRFAQQLRARHLRAAARQSALRTGLPLAVPAVVLAWLLPTFSLPIVCTLLVVTAVAALAGARRGRSLADSSLLQLGVGEQASSGADEGQGEVAAMARLGDELATWLESQRVQPDSAMVEWLARDVARQLPELRAETIERVGQRPLGGLLWLVPLLLILLLAWLLAAWLEPPWPGALGGAVTPPPPSSAPGADAPSSSSGGGGGSPENPKPASPERRESSPPPPAPPEAESPPNPPPSEPPPLLQLPEQQRFLVPEFVGDGPSRRVRMHAAEVADGPPPGQAAGGQGASESPPVPPAERFQRAAEEALRSRHVPTPEQAIVRRYFEALRVAGAKAAAPQEPPK